MVIGEGGSGGALALQVTDRRAQLEDALYATAPPESMASIIFRDASRIREALLISKPTAQDLKKIGVIDQVLPVPEDIKDRQRICRPDRTLSSKIHPGSFPYQDQKTPGTPGKKGPGLWTAPPPRKTS